MTAAHAKTRVLVRGARCPDCGKGKALWRMCEPIALEIVMPFIINHEFARNHFAGRPGTPCECGGQVMLDTMSVPEDYQLQERLP